MRQPSRWCSSRNRTPITEWVAMVGGLAVAKSNADLSSDQIVSQDSIASAETD